MYTLMRPTAIYLTKDSANRRHTNPTIHQPQPLITPHHFSQRCLSVQEFQWLRGLGAESKHRSPFHLTLRST